MYKNIVFERADEFLDALKHDPLLKGVRNGEHTVTVVFDGHNLMLQTDDLHVSLAPGITQEDLLDELFRHFGLKFYWT